MTGASSEIGYELTRLFAADGWGVVLVSGRRERPEEVIIESVGDQGDGIAKVERGYVVIVPDGEPGDQPTVEIDTVRENVSFATIVNPGPGRPSR